MFGRIDHIGVAVATLEDGLALYEEALGLHVEHREIVPEQGVEAVLIEVGEGHIELLVPLGEDTPVGKFLATRGPGLHHVAYQVRDCAAELDRLRGRGIGLIDDVPRIGIRGSRVAFLHPKSTGGVLIELSEY